MSDQIVWCDIPVTNLDRAIRFYSQVLGQEVKKESAPGMTFGLLPHAPARASAAASVKCLTDAKPPSANGPLVYMSLRGASGYCDRRGGDQWRQDF